MATSTETVTPTVQAFREWVFSAAWDMNRDGAVSVSDIWLWIQYGFYLPGNMCLGVVAYIPGLETFFEITPASICGTAAGVISAVFWLFLIGGIWGLVTHDPYVGPPYHS